MRVGRVKFGNVRIKTAPEFCALLQQLRDEREWLAKVESP